MVKCAPPIPLLTPKLYASGCACSPVGVFVREKRGKLGIALDVKMPVRFLSS